MFGFVVGPGLEKLSPSSSGEFFVKIAPRIIRFFQIVAGSTIVFGALLFYVGTSDGDLVFSISSSWGIGVMIGLSFGFVAFLVSEFLAVPPLKKVVEMINDMQASGQKEASPELRSILRRAALIANVTVMLLLLSLVFMVSAGFY